MKNALLCLASLLLPSCSSRIVDPIEMAGPFAADSATVLLADFNRDSVNSVTGVSGNLHRAVFAPALFGSGVRMRDSAAGKYWVAFPNTEAFSLRSGIEGTLEALVWTDSVQAGYAHIIEKNVQYAISVYGGKLAADFGTDWWYSRITLPIGKWSYVAATYDGTTLCLYLNGELAESTPYAGTRSSEYSTAWDLSVGNSSGILDIPFKGIIDAARVSRSIRTPAEIAAVWSGIAKRIR